MSREMADMDYPESQAEKRSKSHKGLPSSSIRQVVETLPQINSTLSDPTSGYGQQLNQLPTQPEIVELDNYRTIASEPEGSDFIINEDFYSDGLGERPVKNEEEILDQD